jgi:peptide/nickel transport system substrate-binding protein
MRRGLLAIFVLAVFSSLLAACSEKQAQIVTVVKEVPVERGVIKEVPKEVVITQEVIKEVPKEVVKEVEKEVVVTREVVKEVVRTVEVEKEKILIATPTPQVGGVAKYGGDLRIVSPGSISTLDPVFSLFYVVNMVASHMYETLFGWDANLEAAPRGVDTWSVTSDGLEYTFTLGDMTFHDGSPFEAEDAARSIYRWRDGGTPAAGIIRRFSGDYDEAITIVDQKTFKWAMNEPLGATIFILGLPHGLMPMMRAEDAKTFFSEAVVERIGTGAYKFVKWDVGDKVVLERYDGYKSRAEKSAPGAYSGEARAYLDSLTWLEIPDEETKTAGLETGEWDVIDQGGFDFYKRERENPDLQVAVYKPGYKANAYLNPQISPFSYQKGRQALQAGISVEDFMFSLGPRDLWIVCDAVYFCGTPLETSFGARYDVETSEGVRTIGNNINDVETARLLLSESDYAGETAVILNPTDYAVLTPLGPVLKQAMEEIGFMVEMPALDWATITSMFGNTDSYSAATDGYPHWCCGNPIQDHLISGTLDFIIRDEDLINLQLAFVRKPDPAKRFKIVEDIQSKRFEKVTNLMLGQWFSIVPATRDLKFLEVSSLPFYANTWLER